MFPIMALLIIFSMGCYHHRYQTTPGVAKVSLPQDSKLPKPDDPKTPWRLAAIEFDEQGDSWSDRDDNGGKTADQLEGAVQAMEALKNGASQLNLLVFIHGWHHNADPNDGNLSGFRDLVAEVARESARPTMGVFVGWRGKILPGYLDYPTTYWGRHTAAQRVGGIRCTEALFRLSKEARKNLDDVTVVLIGHSFGARVLETALGPSVAASLAGWGNPSLKSGATQSSGDANPIHLFPFDLAVLVNEASEAKQGSQILAALKEEKFPRLVDEETQKEFPFMVNVTSTRDKATGMWLRVGQFFGTVPKLLLGGLRTGHYKGIKSYPGQWTLNTRSLAHTPFFHSHRIEKDESGGVGGYRLIPFPKAYNDTSYYVFRAEGQCDLITGHNDIFQDRLRHFIMALAVDRFKKGGSTVLDRMKGQLRMLRPAEVKSLHAE
jgi:hypothetical protein